MSNTVRIINGVEYRDGEVSNHSKDKNPKKSFVFHGDGWSTKSQGGAGNKRGWKTHIPKWLYKKYKNNS